MEGYNRSAELAGSVALLLLAYKTLSNSFKVDAR
jgi:hypothetical protein